VCGAPLAGRFCERCGHDSTAPAASSAEPSPEPSAGPTGSAPPGGLSTWCVVVRADPAWFAAVGRQQGAGAAGLEFPRYAPERRHVLAAERVTIGRRSATRGTAPDIDLAGFDPGVSAAHALLVARPDGDGDHGWDVVDLGSTNGTTLAVDDGPIRPHVPVPLADGAVIRLGAWTTITLTTG
jgi:hypothetical protein